LPPLKGLRQLAAAVGGGGKPPQSAERRQAAALLGDPRNTMSGMHIRTLATLLVLFATTAIAAPKADPRQALEGIDALVEAALADQKIAGASVGVVVNDEVVLLKGYGWRDVERRKPMTPDTMLPIASITKQFTVASLGTLARQGKLDWDAPVRDYMKDFRVNDEYATLHATPRDLVTHRIGLPRHDFAWFGSPSTREELFGKLQHFPFNKDIRTRFQYNNFMYMTAGFLAGRLAGKSYEDHVRTSLFEPVGMTRSNFNLSSVGRDADGSVGYQLNNERAALVVDRFESAEQMAPTGGINSTARDMVRWLSMLLAGGTIDGKRILQQSDVESMMQPNMPIGPSPFTEIGYRSYGMGLFVENYRGHEIAHHGGNMPGAAAIVLMVPREKIGVVVLTNRSGARLRDGLPYEIVDRLLGLPSANMVSRFGDLEKKSFAGEAAAKEARAEVRRSGTQASHKLEEYSGRYAHPGYGPLDVKVDNDALSLTYNGFSSRLDHWHYDVFRALEDRTSRLDRLRVQFQSDLDGEVTGIAVPMDSNVAPIVFAKQPPKEMTERAFLERFTGTYELGGVDVRIALRDDGMLQYIQLGRVRDLVPVRGTLFRIADLTGVSVEFLAGPGGRFDRMALHSGGSTIAPRKNDL
jgi:CubicO group peptidase (beta-lactamase class C family)